MYRHKRKGPKTNLPSRNPHAALPAQPTYWIVAANGTKARIFQSQGYLGKARLLEEIAHPEGFLRNHEIKEGRPGRTFESWRGSFSRHTKSEEESPRLTETRRFATHIAETLKKGRVAKQFDHLILVCEPKFLGILVANIDAVTKRRIRKKIKK